MTCGHRDVHLEIHSTIEALELVQAVTEHIARKVGFDEDTLHWTTMAVRETVINAMSHGNGNDPAKLVFINYSATPDDAPAVFVVSVRDQGPGFDPDTVRDPLTPENILSANGRGIFLVRQFMDDVSIRRAPQGGMEVRMSKQIRQRK